MMGALDQRVKLGRSLSCGARARAPSPLGGAIVGPTVTTRDGRIEGVERDGVHVFRGIPYARPPVGPLRWRAPRPPQAWTGVRDATKAGFAAPQVPGATERIMPGPALETDEDCLTLNVWTPSTPAPPRPVMVWIHGGGFLTGAGSLPIYNGRFLAGGGDVVVVTVNYRLGALGFLAHPVLRDPESGAAGNWGLGMACAVFLGSAALDTLGMSRTLGLACLLQIIGVIITLATPNLQSVAAPLLWSRDLSYSVQSSICSEMLRASSTSMPR